MSKKPLPPEKKEECLRLKAIFESKKKELGLTQEKLAHLLEMNQSSVSHYLNGVNPLNANVAVAFAEILKVPVSDFSRRLSDEIDELLAFVERAKARARAVQASEREEDEAASWQGFEPSNFQIVDQPFRMYRYPVISTVAAGAWTEVVESYPDGFSDRYELSDYKSKGPSFWLEVRGDSMTAPSGMSVPEGMFILVDTGLEARPGRLVVAKLPSSDEATFKKLVEDSGILYLKPLNPEFKMMPCSDDCKIIGVAVRVTGFL
ncbi:S24 family peptidase [Pseudomonas alliivorans]|nr:S24 family peptidase [Pseudomonas alliivorans]